MPPAPRPSHRRPTSQRLPAGYVCTRSSMSSSRARWQRCSPLSHPARSTISRRRHLCPTPGSGLRSTIRAITAVVAELLEAVREQRPRSRISSLPARVRSSARARPARRTSAQPCAPSTPYGVAKLAAFHALVALAPARADGLHASSAILYNHESPRRPETFISRKVTRAAASDQASASPHEVVLGDLDAVRDWSLGADVVRRPAR